LSATKILQEITAEHRKQWSRSDFEHDFTAQLL